MLQLETPTPTPPQQKFALEPEQGTRLAAFFASAVLVFSSFFFCWSLACVDLCWAQSTQLVFRKTFDRLPSARPSQAPSSQTHSLSQKTAGIDEFSPSSSLAANACRGRPSLGLPGLQRHGDETTASHLHHCEMMSCDPGCEETIQTIRC